MKAQDLTAEHLGATITFETPEGVVTGLLSTVRHEADLITNMRLMDEVESFILGRKYTSLTLAGWGERRVASRAEITFKETA